MDNSDLDAACDVPAEIVHRDTLRHQIVVLLAEGKSRKAIAYEVGRSFHTVGDHLKEIYLRTGLRDRVLLAAAVRRVFGDPP